MIINATLYLKAELGGTSLTYPPERSATKHYSGGTSETMNRPLLSREWGAIMGAEVQGHPTGAQPHEGSRKGPSSKLYGYPGAAN